MKIAIALAAVIVAAVSKAMKAMNSITDDEIKFEDEEDDLL